MSGRVRKQSDCPVGKQGPMRATLPVSSLMKQPGGLRKSCGNSPTLSPTNAWRRISPDHALSGQRSPGAVNYKGRIRSNSNTIRRTASLDAIHQRGQWPRDCFYLHSGLLHVDKATQTDDGANRTCSGAGTPVSGGLNLTSEDKLDRYLRLRMQRVTPSHRSHHAAEHASQTMSPIFFSSLKSSGGSVGVPLRAARSSVEGLNQEIERLVLCPTPAHHLDRHRDKITPEGHRAPLAELLRRSVNTQTPAHPDSQSHSAHSSGPPSRESYSSGCSPERLHKPGGSVCSSPDLDSNRLGTSPHINRFLAREPPDGCERVNLKFTESLAGSSKTVGDLCPIKPSIGFELRPSLGSAFQPLQPPTPTPTLSPSQNFQSKESLVSTDD